MHSCHFWNNFYQNTLNWKAYEGYASLAKGSKSFPRILDIGCGNGRNCLPFLDHADEIVGVDTSSVALNEFRQAIAGAKNVKLFNTTVEAFEWQDDYFDLIICHGMLHLIPERYQRRVVEKLKRLTRTSGLNVIVAISSAVNTSETLKHPTYPCNPSKLLEQYSSWQCNLIEDYTALSSADFPYRRQFHRVIWEKLDVG